MNSEIDRSGNQSVQADILGNTRISAGPLTNLLHPDATPPHQIPVDEAAETDLSNIENLIVNGHFGAALQEAQTRQTGGKPLTQVYQFLLQEKVSRAAIGIADIYFIRNDAANARTFYLKAIQPAEDSAAAAVAALAAQTFDELAKTRKGLIDGLLGDVSTGNLADLCQKRNQLNNSLLINAAAIRSSVAPDFTLESVFGENPPIRPLPGWVDPLPPETQFIGFTPITPATIFAAAAAGSVEVDPSLHSGAGGRIPASVAMPVIANVLTAKTRIFALDQGLTLTGQAQGAVPLFRYEYLRDEARRIVSRIQDIESRMLPIQFRLDDFAQAVSVIRANLSEQKAELAAANQKISELVQTITALAQAETQLNTAIRGVIDASGQCDCGFWCWLGAIFLGIAGLGAFVLAVAEFLIGNFGATGSFTIGGVLAELQAINTVTCDNIGGVGQLLTRARDGVHQAVLENQAELTHELAVRDVIVANINSLSHELSEVYASDAAKVLSAGTLNVIQFQYDSLRQSLFSRAQAVAKMAEDAFNFERDFDVHFIKDSYADGLHQDKKGYTHAETLLRDLDGLDFIDVTGRTQKALQISHIISVRKHYPISFASILTSGKVRFATEMSDFDRWFPGTYMQRIREVSVEILLDSGPVPARGYLSNDGVSMARFADVGNTRIVDNIHVFAEPDPDVAALCYKRFQRRRHVDTMAFPDFGSYLHEDRMRKLQDRERNFFENAGPETTWVIELLPDQPFDFSRIADVRVHFQYEAFFDANLKHVLQAKSYLGRRESAGISMANLLERDDRTADFAGTITGTVSADLFENPAISKRIIDAGVAIKVKGRGPLGGAATLEVSYQGASPVQVQTNDQGIVATDQDHPAGGGIPDLETMVRGKSVVGEWQVRIVRLPTGVDSTAIKDIFLLINYEYIVP